MDNFRRIKSLSREEIYNFLNFDYCPLSEKSWWNCKEKDRDCRSCLKWYLWQEQKIVKQKEMHKKALETAWDLIDAIIVDEKMSKNPKIPQFIPPLIEAKSRIEEALENLKEREVKK